MIRADNLTKRYTSSVGEVVALDNISLEVSAGEKIGLLGRSGSGKTTLLNLLAGLDRPTSGSLSVAGKVLSDLTARELAEYRATKIGVVFQAFQLIPQRTALQNVELPLIIGNVAAVDRIDRAKAALNEVGLGDRLEHRPYQLSGGEQQRVAIARALITQPTVLLADEPTGNLDHTTSMRVMDLLMKVTEQANVTLVLVTHDQPLAKQYSDRVIELSGGAILETTPATVDACEVGRDPAIDKDTV